MTRYGMIAVAAAREEELELEHPRSTEAAGTADNGPAQGQGLAQGLLSEDGVRTITGVEGGDGDGMSAGGQQQEDNTEGGHLVATETEVEQQLRQQRLQYQQYQQKKLQQKQQQQQQQQILPPPSQQQPQSELTPQIDTDSAAPLVKIPVVTIRGDTLVRMSSALMRHPSTRSVQSSLAQ